MSDKKPLVPAGIHTEFGDVVAEGGVFHDPTGSDGEILYTPGWSDLRRNYDRALAEIAQGVRDRRDRPTPLPGQLVLARRTRPVRTMSI